MRNLGSLTGYISQCYIMYTLPLSYMTSFLLFVFNSHTVSLAYNGKNMVFPTYKVDLRRKWLYSFVSALIPGGEKINFQLLGITLPYYSASTFNEADVSEQKVLHLHFPALTCITRLTSLLYK